MIVITGMHRSGTSAISNFLYDAGFPFGVSRDEFYPADKWNSKGYYEIAEVHKINNLITLGALGKLAYFHLPSDKTILRRGKAQQGRIRAFRGTYGESVLVKDVRFCLTLPVWRDVVNINKVVFCLRHPAEIAASIRRRNKTPLVLNFQLWDRHVESFLKHIDNIPCFIVDYNRIMNVDSSDMRRHELVGLVKFLGKDITPARITDIADAVFDRRLKLQNRIRSLPPKTEDLWQKLLRRRSEQE